MSFFSKGKPRKHGVMGDAPIEDGRCTSCDGACCRGFFSVELTPEEYLTLQKLGAQRLEFTLTEKFFLIIENGCEFLDGSRCGIYEYRPDICRRFSCIDVADH